MALRLANDFKEFLRLLNSHEVEYLLVGGYASACRLTASNFLPRSRASLSPSATRSEQQR